MKNKGLFLLSFLMLCFCQLARGDSLSETSTKPVQSVLIKTIQLKGNTLLPEAELMELTTHLMGKERTLDDLTQAATAIQQAYREAGYGGVIAFIPEQKLENGDVIIQIVEGKIDRINLSGN